MVPLTADSSVAEWRRYSATLDYRNQAFIGGKYVSARSGARFESINPATKKILTRVASCDAVDVDIAVRAARAAFESGHWSRMSPAGRKKRLLKLADLIERNHIELALLETLDTGKPLRDSLSIDVPLACTYLRWFAEAADKVYGEVAPTGPSVLSLIRREPVGVVAAVLPWNFPLMMACLKIGPALASGNAIIIKPAEQSPLTTIRIAELMAEADIPEGIFGVLPGLGESAGHALGRHMDIDVVAFTGSTIVGKMFLKYSGESNMKRVFLECGGKTPNIVFADAPDLDAAAKAAAWGIFYNQGEVCTAGSRLLCEVSIQDALIEKIIGIGQSMRIGDPLDPQTNMGAIISESQMQRVLQYIERGIEEGASVRSGGKQVHESQGYFVEPTVFDNVKNTMTIAREEIFGPVLSAISISNVDEAVRIANDTIYGLGAAIWTRDINKALNTANALRAGVVWINSFDVGDVCSPSGGIKQSGFGRDKSLHALENFTAIKTTWIDLGNSRGTN